MSTIEQLTEHTFESTRGRAGITVIDFSAQWCAPCRALTPQFERAAALRPNHTFAKVDVDAEPGLAERFGIRSIPTLVVLRDGEPVAAQAGVIGTDELVTALDRLGAGDANTPPAPVTTEAA